MSAETQAREARAKAYVDGEAGKALNGLAHIYSVKAAYLKGAEDECLENEKRWDRLIRSLSRVDTCIEQENSALAERVRVLREAIIAIYRGVEKSHPLISDAYSKALREAGEEAE